MLFACCLVSVPVLAAQVPRVATPGLRVINLDPQLGGFYTEHLAQMMSERGAQVTSPVQIASLLGLERQKQLLGCTGESSSCLVELANALGVDAILTGDIAKLGEVIQINVRLTGAGNARPLASVSTRVADEQHVVDALTLAARTLTTELVTSLGSGFALAPSTPEPIVHARTFSWIPALAGTLIAGTSVWFLVQANAVHRQLLDPTGSLAEGAAVALRDAGKFDQTLGAIGVGVGAAAVAAGVLMFALGGGGEHPAPVAFTPTPNGAFVFVRASW
jgi:hypothetical protein